MLLTCNVHQGSHLYHDRHCSSVSGGTLEVMSLLSPLTPALLLMTRMASMLA